MDSYKAEIERRDKELARRNDQIAALSRLEAINSDLAGDLRDLQDDFSALKIKGEEEKMKKEEPDMVKPKHEEIEDEIAIYKPSIRSILRGIKSSIYRPKETVKDINIFIVDEQKIVIQDLFDTWYNADVKDPPYLMHNLVKKTSSGARTNVHYDNTRKVLWPWKVDIGKAIDEGGPTRAFVSAFNDQMGYLSISIDIPSSIISSVKPESGFGQRRIEAKLFTDVHGSFVPVRDEYFDDLVEMEAMKCGIVADYHKRDLRNKIKAKAFMFYRAIGRMFIHIIFTAVKSNAEEESNTEEASTISSKLLPEMLRNVLLRGVYPGTASYGNIKDITVDIHAMGDKAVFDYWKPGDCSFETAGLGDDL